MQTLCKSKRKVILAASTALQLLETTLWRRRRAWGRAHCQRRLRRQPHGQPRAPAQMRLISTQTYDPKTCASRLRGVLAHSTTGA